MFALRADGVLVGLFSVRQFDGQEEIAEDHPDVIAFLNPTPTREQLELEQARQDVTVRALVNRTPAEVEQWVDENVTSLAGARVALKIIARLLILLGRRL
jgi:hypothetical protein